MSNKEKYQEKYQEIYNQFKKDHSTEGYELNLVDEIYLPFWTCKQNIEVQMELVLDRFSEILLRLVKQGLKKRSEICKFLGIDEDDFTLMQFNFLLNEGFLEENANKLNQIYYEITHEGRDFLEGKMQESKLTIETAEVEYVLNDLEYLTEKKYNEFFDKAQPIDNQSNKNFSGYKYVPTPKLSKNHIPHSEKPALRKINNLNFIDFYNKSHQEGIFYDFVNKKIEAHKRSILFTLLYFKNRNEEEIVEIRHCKTSVNKFDKECRMLEKTLSEKVKIYIQKDPHFIKKLQDINGGTD